MGELTPLPQLVAEIKILSQQQAINIIEIGKRLIEAKQQLNHGEWGPWLEQNVPYSQRWANQYMKVATEFSNWNSSSNLGQKKFFALLDVPAADRETFIAQPHEVNGQQKTVDEMTSRELAAAIKALKDAERDRAEKDRMIQEQARKLQSTSDALEAARVKATQLEAMKKPDTVTIEKRVEVIPPDYEATKQKLKEANAKIDKYMDEQLGQAQAIFKAGKRAEIRGKIAQLAREIGKTVKEVDFLIRALPGDDDVSHDLHECAELLRDTADSLENMGTGKGVTLDVEHYIRDV